MVTVSKLAERLYRTEAVVLRHRPYGEADLIVTLYTPHHGKISAMAKGVRRPASKRRGHIELFTRTQLLLRRGRTFDQISDAQTLEAHRRLRADTVASQEPVYAAYTIAEQVDRLTEEGQENRAIWDLLTSSLRALDEGVIPKAVEWSFALRLLGYLGYQPGLDSCAGCGEPLQPVVNAYSVDLGGVLCPDCRAEDPAAEPLSVNALKLLRLLARESPAAVARLRFSSALAAEVEDVLRRALRQVADRDFASPAVLRSLRGE